MKIDYKRSHEGLWNWLAKNPRKMKEDWPGWKTLENLKIDYGWGHCFACEFVGYNIKKGRRCDKCPVDFGTGNKAKYNCDSQDASNFVKWQSTSKSQERTKYALKIAQGWKE